MLTLSKAYEKPEDGDDSSLWFPALAANVTRCNDHNHDGNDSTLLAKTQSIASGSWGAADADGAYSQTIALASGLEFDSISVQIRIASTGEIIFPKVVKTSSTSYTISVNDNSLALTAVYI